MCARTIELYYPVGYGVRLCTARDRKIITLAGISNFGECANVSQNALGHLNG